MAHETRAFPAERPGRNAGVPPAPTLNLFHVDAGETPAPGNAVEPILREGTRDACVPGKDGEGSEPSIRSPRPRIRTAWPFRM